MFKSILFTVFSLLCLSFINAKPVSQSDIHSGVISVLSEMGSTINSMKKMHSVFVTMADDPSNSALCATAAQEAAGNITTDCSVLFASGGSIDLSQFTKFETIDAACTNTFSNQVVAKCALTFTTKYQNAIKVCGANNAATVTSAIITGAGGKLDVFANLTSLVTLGNAICTKDNDGSYCIGKLIKAGVTDAFSDLSKLNNTLQNVVCTECTKKLINALAATNVTANANLKALLDGLKFVCSTDPTNNAVGCLDSMKVLVQFKGKVSKDEISATISAMSEADINTLCSPCTMSVINSIETIAPRTNGQISDVDVQILKGAKATIKGVCVRDPQNGNSFCPAVFKGPLLQWATDLSKDSASLFPCAGLLNTANPVCTAECSGLINAKLSSFSCCLGLPEVELAAVSKFLPNTGTVPMATVFASAVAKCTITKPVACAGPAIATLPVTFVLNNLRYSWATGAETKAKFEAALKSDIASAFSLDATAVTLGQITSNANGGVTVTVQLSVDSSVANGYRATIQSRIEASMSFGATTTEADKDAQASKVDQTKGVQADPQASTVGGASGAVAATSIVGAVFVTIASLIAMKFY